MPVLTDEQHQDKVINDASKELLKTIPMSYDAYLLIKKYLEYTYTIGFNRAKQKGNVGRNIAVEQVHLGKVINTFKSIADAGRTIGISGEAIRKVLIKEQNTAGGYFWRHKNSP